MRRSVAAVVVFALCTAPLGAELKVTSKVVARPPADGSTSTDLIGALVGPMITEMFGGTEGVEMTITMHEDGRTRTDYVGAFAGMPAGAVVIVRADGSSVGFDAKAQTWWKMVNPMDDPGTAAGLAQLKPVVSNQRTGEFATIAGFKAERVSVTMQTDIPMQPGAQQLPPQMQAMIPKEIRVDGDAWVAPVHVKYMKTMAKVIAPGPLAGVGLDKLFNDLLGLSVRMVMRLNILKGWELETLVSKVVEEDVPDTVFDLPAGYKEIPMPTGSGKLPAV